MKRRIKNKLAKTVIIEKIVISSKDKLSTYLIGFGTLIILAFNAYIFFLNSYPETDLIIESVQLEIDHEAKRDSTLLNQFYFEIRIYNNGKKANTIRSIDIKITDDNAPNTITRQHKIYYPSFINPGQLKPFILKLYVLKLFYQATDTLFTEYKLPYKSSYKEWKKEAEPLNKEQFPVFSLPLLRPVKLSIIIDAINKKYKYETEVNVVNFQNIKTFYNLSKTMVI